MTPIDVDPHSLGVACDKVIGDTLGDVLFDSLGFVGKCRIECEPG